MASAFRGLSPRALSGWYVLTASWLAVRHDYRVGRADLRLPVIMMNFYRVLVVVLLSCVQPVSAVGADGSGEGSRQSRRDAETAYRVLSEVAALAVGLDPLLVQALIEVESAWRPRAVSVDGAVGLMQILPTTGDDYVRGADLTDPVTNLRIGVTHLAGLVRRFGLVRAIAAWNAGAGAVLRCPVFERYGETRRFVARVLLEWERLRGVRPEGPDLAVSRTWTGGVSRLPEPSGGAQ